MIRISTAPPPTDPLGPVGQNPDTVRDAACRIVSQDAAACTPATVPKPTIPTQGTGNFDVIGTLLWILLAAAVVVLVVFLVRWGGQRTGRWKRRAEQEVDADPTDDVIEPRVVAIDWSKEPGEWRSEADEHRRAGRFRDAVRCRYRALVGDLARRGLIDEVPGRTTGEHRDQMREVRPAVSPEFDEAAELFDGAWYGRAHVGADDDDHFKVLARDVMTAAERRK